MPGRALPRRRLDVPSGWERNRARRAERSALSRRIANVPRGRSGGGDVSRSALRRAGSSVLRSAAPPRRRSDLASRRAGVHLLGAGKTMWELILSGGRYNELPALPGEVVPRLGRDRYAFRGRTKFDAIQRAVAGLSSIPRSMLTECLYGAAMKSLSDAQRRFWAPLATPGWNCNYSWRYVSPTMRQTPARASFPALMSRFFSTMGIGAKKSGACCEGCETGTGCADPSTGCTGACMTSTGCDCKRKKPQTVVGACLSYLYGTGCPSPQITGFQTGGGCGGGGCGGGGYGPGCGSYDSLACCGYSTPCNIGCGSTAGCGSSGCGPGGCGNCGSGSVGCGPCLLGGWGYG